MMEVWVRVVAPEMLRSDPEYVCTLKVESGGFTDILNLR